MSLLSRVSVAGRALGTVVASAAVAAAGSDEMLDRLGYLLSISGYQRPPMQPHPALEDEFTKAIRTVYSGNLYPLPTTRTRWFLRDLESVQAQADQGWLYLVGQLSRAMRRDGTLFGLLNARMAGTVSLPKIWSGNQELAAILRGRGGARPVFDEMFPRTELASLAIDEYFGGVAVGEMLPIEGRDYPMLQRLDPEFLQYRWIENRWYYHSVVGPLPVTPGDGRWILHIGGSRLQPWNWGMWHPCGLTWISKTHSLLQEANWQAKLANPLRVAQSPQGASEGDHTAWFRAALSWAMNTVLAAKPGYEIKLVESNGNGHESFTDTIERCDKEYMIEVMGNVVSTQGGVGFNSPDLFKQVRHDLKVKTADSISDTVCTQGIPPWVLDTFGPEALADYPTYKYDVREPKDLSVEATSFAALAAAVKQLAVAIAPYGLELGVRELLSRFNVPVAGDWREDGFDEVDGDTDSTRAALFLFDISTIDTAIALGERHGVKPTKEAIKSLLGSMGIATEDAPVPVKPAAENTDGEAVAA